MVPGKKANKKSQNYSAPFVLAKNGRFRMKESTDHQADASIQMLNCNELQMLVLYVFILFGFSRWRVSPKIGTRETSGAKQEASNILKPSLNYLLFRPKHHNFPSSHCLSLGLYISAPKGAQSANQATWQTPKCGCAREPCLVRRPIIPSDSHRPDTVTH